MTHKKIIWNKNHDVQGIVLNKSTRYCAACGRNHTYLFVEWENGKRTKPCTAGIRQLFNGELQIV